MGLIEGLQGKIIYVDTSPIIYYIEKNYPLFSSVERLFRAQIQGEVILITSVLTLAEVLAQPNEKRREDLSEQYETILSNSSNIALLDVGTTEARTAASLRAHYKLSLPDALHLATAIENKADYFLTNDKRIAKTVPIELLMLSDV
jgi:predicted nucleic acid-binding protein